MQKNLQHLSKRRKNQLICEKIESYRHQNVSNDPDISSVPSHFTLRACIEENSTTHSTSYVNNDESTVDNFRLGSNSNLECSSSSRTSSVRNYEDVNIVNNSEYSISSSLNNDVENIDKNLGFDNDSKDEYLRNRLQQWVNSEKISHISVNKLLLILHDIGHKLPRDVRTLMHTPRSAINAIMEMSDSGCYVHFGLINGLQRSIDKYLIQVPDSIKLLINCDGMSLSFNELNLISLKNLVYKYIFFS